jgi:hypothetical protein
MGPTPRARRRARHWASPLAAVFATSCSSRRGSKWRPSGRRQAVVGLQARAPSGARARIAGICAGSVPVSMMDETNAANSGGDQPLLSGEFGMHEVEAVERVRLVLDAAVHVHAAAAAGMALDDGALAIDDLQLFRMRGDLTLSRETTANLREQGAGRLPALAAAAGVVVRGLRADGHFDLVGGALATQHAPFESPAAPAVFRRLSTGESSTVLLMDCFLLPCRDAVAKGPAPRMCHRSGTPAVSPPCAGVPYAASSERGK